MRLRLEEGFKQTYNNKFWKLFCRECFFEGIYLVEIQKKKYRIILTKLNYYRRMSGYIIFDF